MTLESEISAAQLNNIYACAVELTVSLMFEHVAQERKK